MNMSINRCLNEKTNPLQRVTGKGAMAPHPTPGSPNDVISTLDLHDIFLAYCMHCFDVNENIYNSKIEVTT